MNRKLWVRPDEYDLILFPRMSSNWRFGADPHDPYAIWLGRVSPQVEIRAQWLVNQVSWKGCVA